MREDERVCPLLPALVEAIYRPVSVSVFDVRAQTRIIDCGNATQRTSAIYCNATSAFVTRNSFGDKTYNNNLSGLDICSAASERA